MELLAAVGVLAAMFFAATKLETTELAFAVLACGAVGSWLDLPYRFVSSAAIMAFIVRYVRFAGTGR